MRFRKGQLTLVAAAPGGFKSLLATTLALYSKVPSIYFSADSDKMTFGTRVMSTALGLPMAEAEQLLLTKDENALADLDQLTDHIWVNFDSSPSPREIDSEIDCFGSIYGEFPQLVIIDNLIDVAALSDDTGSSHDAILEFCKDLARKTSAAVVVLCHVTGAHTDGNEIIPRSGLMYKIDKRPRLILTMHRANENGLGVSVVKNSNGKAASDGTMIIELPLIAERAWIGRGE